MRLNDEKMRKAREARIRAIVREEIVAALGALAREAADQDTPYDTAELDSRALGNIEKVAEGAVRRLTCPHEEYYTWHDVPKCARCSEPEPEPVNPFEPEHEHTYDDNEGTPTDCIECGAPYPTQEG